MWLWLATVAPIQLPAWEPPYAVGVALKKCVCVCVCEIYSENHTQGVPIMAQWVKDLMSL